MWCTGKVVMEISEREVSFLWTQISPWQTKDLLYSETTAPTSTPQPPTKHSLTITEFKILVKHSCLFVSRDMHVKCRGVLASLPLHSLLFFFFFRQQIKSRETKVCVFFFLDRFTIFEFDGSHFWTSHPWWVLRVSKKGAN